MASGAILQQQPANSGSAGSASAWSNENRTHFLLLHRTTHLLLTEGKDPTVVSLDYAAKAVKAVKGCVDSGLTEARLAQQGRSDPSTAVAVTGVSCGAKILSGRADDVGSKVILEIVSATATEHQVLSDKFDKLPKDPSQESKWTAADYTRMAATFASLADPTGASGVVAAYTYPKCSAIFPNLPR